MPTGSPGSSPASRTSAPSGRHATSGSSTSLPITATSKILKRVLRNEGWHSDDPVWWQPTRDAPYRLMVAADVDELDRVIASR